MKKVYIFKFFYIILVVKLCVLMLVVYPHVMNNLENSPAAAKMNLWDLSKAQCVMIYPLVSVSLSGVHAD